MEERLHRLAQIGSVLILVTTSATLGYTRWTDQVAYQGVIDNQAIRLQDAESQIKHLSSDLTASTRQLEATNKKVTEQQATLDKITTDLAAKQKELDSASKKIKDQESQLAANSSELSKLRNRPPLFSFSVESSSLANVEQKKEDVKQVVTAAYDVIADIYGKPYLLHSVTIAFVNSFSNDNALAEINISNSSDGLAITIKLKDFDKNNFNDVQAVVHEMIHSFHGLSVLSPVAYEEGETVAATDVVVARLIDQDKIPSFKPLYIRMSESEYRDSSLTIPTSTSKFYTSDDVSEYYQLIGYGWYQLYKADPDFFKNFNETIYSQKREGNEVTAEMVTTTVESVLHKSVAGGSVPDWLKTKAFALGN